MIQLRSKNIESKKCKKMVLSLRWKPYLFYPCPSYFGWNSNPRRSFLHLSETNFLYYMDAFNLAVSVH